MKTVLHHAAVWQTAQPLWAPSLADQPVDPALARLHAPAILRFKGDDFMAQLQRALGTPGGVQALVLRSESWREEQAGWLDAASAAAAPIPKLFQPAHYRFYLVSAALVCQTPGLPDRRIDAARAETASFVLRRLWARPGAALDPRKPETYEEYGWAGTAQEGTWRPVPVRGELAAWEERIPLSPSQFQAEGQPRRLLMGMIPAARRDVYEAGAAASEPPASAGALAGDPFASEDLAVALEQVLPALEAFSDPEQLQPLIDPGAAGAAEAEAAQLAMDKLAVAHALLSLQEYLAERCTATWEALKSGSDAGLSSGAAALFHRLSAMATGTSVSYREILSAVERGRSTLTDGEPSAAFLDGLWGGAPLGRASLRWMVRRLVKGPEESLLVAGAPIAPDSEALLEDLLRAALPDPREKAFQRSVGVALVAAASPAPDDDAAQDALWAALLALADFLRAELPALWTAVASAAPAGLSTTDRAVYDLLASAKLGAGDWRALLADTDGHRLELLGGRITPAVQVVALRPSAAAIAGSVAAVTESLSVTIGAALVARPMAASLAAGEGAAMSAGAAASPGAEASPVDATASQVDATASLVDATASLVDAAYVIRCAYERPRCNGFAPAVVSEPSAPFQLASFFDADAPVRPIRIAMPDVSLKALRKGPRGVRIAVSKELRAQLERVRGISLEKLGKGELKPPAPFSAGVVCALSIPIITIVALIILMVMVSLLNLVFFWMPYFQFCMPIPKPSSASGSGSGAGGSP